MNKTAFAIALMGLLAGVQARQVPERPSTTWTFTANDDKIVDEEGVLHTASVSSVDTERHAFATLQLPIPQKARGFDLAFDLKLGEGNSTPVIFEARAGSKKPLHISYSGVDNRCRISLAGNEVSSKVADKEWHSYKLSNSQGKLSLTCDGETVGTLPNSTIPDLIRFGGEYGVKGKQSEAWLRLVSAKFALPDPDAKTPVPVADKEPEPKDKTPLATSTIAFEVADVSNPKGRDPAILAGAGPDNWYVHMSLKNQGYAPVNFYDFGTPWLKFDNYQSVSGVPFIWDPAMANPNNGTKGIYRAAKRAECWVPPGQMVEVFYYFNLPKTMSGQPVGVEFLSGGSFKYAIPPP